MVTAPVLHGPATSVATARAALVDPHRHMVLLVDGTRLLGTVTRADLDPGLAPQDAVLAVARLAGRTVRPDDGLWAIQAVMLAAGERRRAVVDAEGELRGLLCLKASGRGFCSDAGVAARALSA